jgi:hypothetical protein
VQDVAAIHGGLLPVFSRASVAEPWPAQWRRGTSRICPIDRSPAAFFGTAFANALTTAITLDVYLAALAFSVGVALYGGAGARRWWAVPMTFFIGLSFALPAYLWWRSAPRRG